MMTQLQLPDTRSLEAQRPRDLMEDALVWIERNPEAWQRLVRLAHTDAERGGRVRVKSYIEFLRISPLVRHVTGSPVKLPNAYSAPFGRILRAWYPELAEFIPLAHSKTDGLVIPERPY